MWYATVQNVLLGKNMHHGESRRVESLAVAAGYDPGLGLRLLQGVSVVERVGARACGRVRRDVQTRIESDLSVVRHGGTYWVGPLAIANSVQPIAPATSAPERVWVEARDASVASRVAV